MPLDTLLAISGSNLQPPEDFVQESLKKGLPHQPQFFQVEHQHCTATFHSRIEFFDHYLQHTHHSIDTTPP